MAENKFTDKQLRALKPTDREQNVGDGGGLWVRVLPASKGGTINFYYRFTSQGRERRYNCGSYPATSLAEARKNRNRARETVRLGLDPVIKEEQDRRTAAANQAIEESNKSVEQLFNDWKQVYLSVHRKDGGKEVEAAFRRDVFPVIGSMRAKDVKLAHINQVIDRILERGARRTANLTLSIMRQMFRHGMGRAIVETDPTLGLTKKHAGGKETPVERNLSLAEIELLRTKIASSELPERHQAAVWLLLATGARVGELAKARWGDINITDKTWKIPAENSKNGREHLIHLSAFSISQLSALEQYRDGSYLLPGQIRKKRIEAAGSTERIELPISEKTISKAIRDRIRSEPLKRRTRRTQTLLLPGGEWSPHDLRRTMASRMGDLGIAPHIIERCLNHVQQGIVGVYQRQEYLPERKAAFEKWGRRLARILGAREEDNA